MDRSPLPLLNHPLEQASAFTPEALIAAVRDERGLTAKPVPPVCVLDFDGDLTDWLVSSRAAMPRLGVLPHDNALDGITCAIVPRTIGGPYAVLVAEQLAASGARIVFGLTSAGRVSSSLPVPSLVVATQAIRDEGTSYHYLPPGEMIECNAGVVEALLSEVSAVGLPVSAGLVWTTDAPYRETLEQLDVLQMLVS